MSNWLIFLLSFTVILFLMASLWGIANKIKNYSIVDALWSYSFLIQAFIFYFFCQGYFLRKILFLSMIGIWSLRLGSFLTIRIFKHHPQVDSRYLALANEYGQNYKFRFLLFYITQALSVSLLTIPFIFVFQNTNTQMSFFEYWGLGLWIISFLGEGLADHQMNAFRSNPINKGEVCNIGLWKYSRHPNYFFESMIWWSFFLASLGTSNLWWAIYCPLIILFLLLKVTGVPLSEAQSLKSRGDKYRRYQDNTSMFIPWFRSN